MSAATVGFSQSPTADRAKEKAEREAAKKQKQEKK